MRALWIGLFAALGLASPASALICSSIPYTFSNGTTADATQVNANFSAFQSCVNTNAATAGANSNITSLTGLTSILVSGSGTFGSITSSGDITMTGTGELVLPVGTTGQRNGSPTNGMIRFNTTTGAYEGYTAATTTWGPLATAVPVTPQGRLTLTTAVPVLTSTVTAAASVLYTPYNGSQFPVWNGSAFVSQQFAEFSQALSDTTLSPAAAVSGAVYDIFGWYNSGTSTLSFTRGPAWTNATTRGYTLSRVQGLLVNASSIFNGPAAGYGVYVGTIMTDAGGATVTFNPTPAAASGGPTGGAWVGLWNTYNRAPLEAVVQDNKASWSYSSAAWRASDNSNNNRVTWIMGLAEWPMHAIFAEGITSGAATFSLGLDSVSSPSGQAGTVYNNAGTATAVYATPAQVGQHYIQGLEYETTGGTATIIGLSASGNVFGQAHQITLQTSY